MNDYSIQQAKNNLFQVNVHVGPGLDTGLVAFYKVRPTISVFDKHD